MIEVCSHIYAYPNAFEIVIWTRICMMANGIPRACADGMDKPKNGVDKVLRHCNGNERTRFIPTWIRLFMELERINNLHNGG